MTTPAVEAALGLLRHRDRGTDEIRARLKAAGYGDQELDEAIETLVRTGLLNDARFAELRARSLAERGAGDLRIRHELERASISSELVERALDAVEPEAERGRSIVARRGPGAKTARFLSGRGFSEEVVASAVAGGPEDELG